MFKKIYQIIFIVIFLGILTAPLIFMNRSKGGVSTEENRVLATMPSIMDGKQLNENFTTEFEAYFRDHMGMREELIDWNAKLQFTLFDRMLDESFYLIGRNGDINYANEDMMKDYARLNLRNSKQVEGMGVSYQTISDWLGERGIPFYYVQCYDKHNIYPEQFTDAVIQNGDVSRTDQIMTYLKENTTVNLIDLKPVLLDAKQHYEVYSNWGDPTHWTDRGAYVGYRYLMEQLNQDFDGQFKVLEESDYDIDFREGGITLNKVIHRDDMLEFFTIKDPQATKTDVSVLGQWAEDHRHSVWINPNAGNDKRLLLICDSYFNNYIIDDLAEGFGEVWLVWGDYIKDLPQLVEHCQPDLVVFECVERVERSAAVKELAQSLAQE